MVESGFSEDHLDVLKELMNIAVGNATASIADLLQTFGTMHIPQIMISDMVGLDAYIKNAIPEEKQYYITKQLFGGIFSGEFLFVICENSAINLGRHLYDVNQNPTDEDIHDAVIELTNILSATIISRLTEELNTKVQFFVPSTERIVGNSIIGQDELLNYHKIIIISTEMVFEDQQIGGKIFILTKDEMIKKLKALIDQKLEELYA
ncbi:MAG: chemotaxis protein CheC [Sulfuricurvum sp.]|uniref:chemotaxis protein CheC n=1 Tax=Sulfuricurvum sp. TaxID=2025608 RepID=UPI0025EEA531|nr:chemotaxis protein CheC [Sulfuricurvum sp.]MBV5320418.1 chemotaxis protein CheC [Sulfuricurvum sp.]